MNHNALRIATPVLACSLALSACGGAEKTTTAATTAATSTGAVMTTTAAGPVATTTDVVPADCPTEATRHFAKTRFVADLGLAAGTFHRWIYTPYQAGTFKEGAPGRKTAIAKGLAVAALDYKLINNAYDNVRADPSMCKALSGPLGKLKDTASQMAGGIAKGDLSSVVAAQGLVSQVMESSKAAGMPVTETTDESKADLSSN
ncbi:hypothetical protein [Arsenicicoccus dermatophilus]|uniref:hypothetical protein n=1 Tax=Arsenicicoccus dermatophilus TaxID=1076331 RepID=UPI001F4CA3BC|nr:hypothetical protein [Arsenicicoccus dermatophilus]MCH8611545.1 hypothetical protein [Arsenicicoccus dermatophilus]